MRTRWVLLTHIRLPPAAYCLLSFLSEGDSHGPMFPSYCEYTQMLVCLPLCLYTYICAWLFSFALAGWLSLIVPSTVMLCLLPHQHQWTPTTIGLGKDFLLGLSIWQTYLLGVWEKAFSLATPELYDSSPLKVRKAIRMPRPAYVGRALARKLCCRFTAFTAFIKLVHLKLV